MCTFFELLRERSRVLTFALKGGRGSIDRTECMQFYPEVAPHTKSGRRCRMRWEVGGMVCSADARDRSCRALVSARHGENRNEYFHATQRAAKMILKRKYVDLHHFNVRTRKSWIHRVNHTISTTFRSKTCPYRSKLSRRAPPVDDSCSFISSSAHTHTHNARQLVPSTQNNALISKRLLFGSTVPARWYETRKRVQTDYL